VDNRYDEKKKSVFKYCSGELKICQRFFNAYTNISIQKRRFLIVCQIQSLTRKVQKSALDLGQPRYHKLAYCRKYFSNQHETLIYEICKKNST